MKQLRWIPALGAVALALCACMDHLTQEDFNRNKAQEEDFLSFETTRDVTLDLDYGQLGARALIKIYDQDPLLQQDGESVLDTTLNPVYQQFTDSYGTVRTDIDLPSHVTEGVWIYSSFMGLPTCEYCPIMSDVIWNWREEADTKAGLTKALSASPYAYQLSGNFYTLVKWADKYGKPNDFNGLNGTGDLSASDITAVKAAVWNGKSSKPSGLDNTQYTNKGTEYINTTIRQYYHDSEGKVQTVDGVEVFFTFVTEECWNQNVVGYYFYPSGQEPSGPEDVKKYVIIPNASISGNAPYGAKGNNNTNYGQANAPISANSKVQLLYEDADGNMQAKFPANVTIGYFIIADGWNVDGKTSFTEPASGTKASVMAFPADTKAGGNVSVEVGKTVTISLDDAHYNVSWKSSNANVATVSGESGLLTQSKEATVKGIKAGTAKITATYRNLLGWSQTVTWTVTVSAGSSSPDTGGTTLDGAIDFSQPVYYSNEKWNSQSMCMTRSTNGYKIYGFEDGGDKSYEDVVFTISSTPMQAILDPDDPDVIDEEDLDEEKLKVGQRDFATYCFEDLWPYMGDYDMNDVVIQHVTAFMFDNDNDILEVRDSFTVCNELLSSGEDVKDAFAVRIPIAQRGVMTLPSSAVIEEETGSVILFESAQDHLRETFVITRAFDKGTVTLDGFTRGLDLDPYIIPIFSNDTVNYLSSRRREVHFPKKSGTSKIDESYFKSTQQAYFVAMDNRHPFAVSIPLPVAQTAAEIAQAKKDGSMFIVSQEMYEVDGQYAKSGHDYATWVSSGLTECTDWYKHYQISDAQQVERFDMNTKDIQPKVFK